MSTPRLDVPEQVARVQKKINLSKTVRKVPISSDMSQKGTAMRDETLPMPQYDEVRSVRMVLGQAGMQTACLTWSLVYCS